MVSIAVIIGSTRENRFTEKPARWIAEQAQQRGDIEVTVLDLRDYPMPFFEEAIAPAYVGHPPYESPAVNAWTAAVGAADGYIIVSPEYNHGYPAVLKNALDYVFPEWNRKPVAFVSFGNVGGARVVEQLREVAVELEMAPIRRAVHVPVEILRDFFFAGKEPDFNTINDVATGMLDELVWWAQALKTAREASVELAAIG